MILAHNFHHRHLDTGQKAMIYAEAREMLGVLRKPVNDTKLGAGAGKPVNLLADGSEISKPTKAAAATVVEQGTDDLRDSAKQGEIGVKPHQFAAVTQNGAFPHRLTHKGVLWSNRPQNRNTT